MSNTPLERVKTWIAAHAAASAARDAEIAEHGFEVNDDRWLDVLALMPPVQEIAEGLVASAAEVQRLTAELEESHATIKEGLLAGPLVTGRTDTSLRVRDRLLGWVLTSFAMELERSDAPNNLSISMTPDEAHPYAGYRLDLSIARPEHPCVHEQNAELRAQVERLTAERAAVRAALVDSGTEPVTEDMGRLAALVAAQLADEVATIARLEQEVGRLQSALGGEIEIRQAAEAEVERLTALVERQRLTLLAEQGIAEGAPSDRWTWGIIDEEGGIGWKRRTARGMIFAWGRGVELGSRGQPSEPHPGGWAEWTTNEDGDLDDEIARATDALWNALDAMEAAEAAHPSTPETDRP